MKEKILGLFDKNGESIARCDNGEIDLYTDSFGYVWWRQNNELINMDFVYKVHIEEEE